MGGEVFQSASDGCHIGCSEISQSRAAMHFQRPHGSYQNDHRRGQPGLPAFDVEKFLTTQIKRETSFGDREIRITQGQTRGQHGIASMGNIGKRSAMDKGGHSLHGLHQIGCQSIAQDGHHSTGYPEFPRLYRVTLRGEADYHAAQSCPQICLIFRQAKHCHDLRSCRNIKSAAALVCASAYGDPA